MATQQEIFYARVAAVNVGSFATLVKEMRDCQKEYFKTRSRYALIRSKSLEIAVDMAVYEGLNPHKR